MSLPIVRTPAQLSVKLAPSPRAGDRTRETAVRPGALAAQPPRSGELSRLADQLLADIDAQMRSLSADELEQLKPQFDDLLEASILLADRETADPSRLGEAKLKHMRATANQLARHIKTGDPSRPHGGDTASRARFSAVRQTLQQLSHRLGCELRATLREARQALPLPDPAAAAKKTPLEQALSGLQQLQDARATQGRKPINDLLSTVFQARTLIQNLSEEADLDSWMTPCRNHAAEQILRQRHAALSECLATMKSFGDLHALTDDLRHPVEDFIQLAERWESHLQLHLDMHDDYQSPDSIANICDARQLEIDAAIRVLESQDNAANHRQMVDALKTRRKRLERLKLAPGDVDAGRLLGKKAVASRFRHPIDAARQAVKLEKAGQRWLAAAAGGAAGGAAIARRASVELDGISEPMLMEWLLKKAGVADAGKALRAAHRSVLDSRPFDVIRSDIVVPVQGMAAPMALKATTTPASHVLCDPSRIALSDGNSVLNPANAGMYLHPAPDGSQVRGGFNSHDTAESFHPTLAAHDEMTMDGQVLFGATRHGVAAPYSLGTELKTMPDHAASALVQQLLGPELRHPTRLTMAWEAGAPLSAPAQSRLQPALRNPIRMDFEDLLESKIRQESSLANALFESGLAQAATDPAEPLPSAGELMTRPEHAGRLLAMIRQHPDLQALLVRQASLNRVRELVILEIARDPKLGKKIAAGESVLFTSVSLLTPDSLRHIVSGLAGGSSFDERTMLEIQLQAWKDLKLEIDADGVVINGKALRATFCPFNWGVNDMALMGPGSDPVIGEAISGHDFSNRACNEASLKKMVGLPSDEDAGHAANATDQAVARMEREIHELGRSGNTRESLKRRKQLDTDLKVIRQLRDQIRQMWEDGSYRRAGNEPYKMAARIALLSFLIDGGTLFNCKSGKDRTGQLSVEAKFLAVRIRNGDGHVPRPDETSTPWEHVQYGCLMFYDKARTRMQKYATGYEGSKLSYAKKAFAYFTQAFKSLPASEKIRLVEAQVREFVGLSARTKF